MEGTRQLLEWNGMSKQTKPNLHPWSARLPLAYGGLGPPYLTFALRPPR